MRRPIVLPSTLFMLFSVAIAGCGDSGTNPVRLARSGICAGSPAPVLFDHGL